MRSTKNVLAASCPSPSTVGEQRPRDRTLTVNAYVPEPALSQVDELPPPELADVERVVLGVRVAIGRRHHEHTCRGEDACDLVNKAFLFRRCSISSNATTKSNEAASNPERLRASPTMNDKFSWM